MKLCKVLSLFLFVLILFSCSNPTTTSSEDTAKKDVISNDVEKDLGCSNECNDLSETKCDGNAILYCGNFDDDPCLEWGNKTNCAEGLSCVNGHCEKTCQNECTVLGTKKCKGNAVQTCDDYDGDGCLEWGGDKDCGNLSCSNGFCSVTCQDECTVVGAKVCDGNGYKVCGQYDNDECLDFSEVIECKENETCSNGNCKTTCENECTIVGAKKCNDSNTGYKVCGDYNNDGCLEWGTDNLCQQGYVCSNGNCAKSCQNECSVSGTKKCNDAKTGYYVCDDYNGDGCLEWGSSIECGEGFICSNGYCSKNCENECTVKGAKKCDSTSSYVICDDYNDDGCLEWGSSVSCEQGETCSNGNCSITCKNECTTVGSKKCNDSNTGYKVCGDYNNDGCLEWGQDILCDEGQVCSNGNCKQTCENECTVKGTKKCSGDSAYMICDDYNNDGCLEWGSAINCGENETCSSGICSVTCKNECTTVGTKKCNDTNTGYKVCGDYNNDGCLEWGDPILCEQGYVCSNGNCSSSCENECTVKGAKKCAGDISYQVCDDYNNDGCLEWGSEVTCGENQVCSNGICSINCNDECDTMGEKKCNDTNTGYMICNEYDGDGCLEWGTPVLCDEGYVCSNGNCAQTCQDECNAAGTKKCDDAKTGYFVCDDYNNDGCLEWGSLVNCDLTETCDNGVCVKKAVPGNVVINEILYNPVGSDTASTSNSFVELFGEPGLDLTGFTLVGLNGANGQIYKTIELSGKIPSDGYFVVSRISADYADMVTDQADFQNGPDNILLKWGDDVVDAVGYGSFSGSQVFAGEGNPAKGVSEGHSLGRDENSTDTDDNFSDFHDYKTPTPGSKNISENNPPVAKISCPSSGVVGETLSFDGSGSSDSDGTIVSYEFDFGDGNTQKGVKANAEHSYSSSGNYTVTLKVTDDKGASDTASCTITITSAEGPDVVIIKPGTDLQVTQGDTINVIIDATPNPGTSVVKVELLANGTPVGSPDTSPPYEFSYTVPENQPVNTTIELKGRATDSNGGVGVSSPRILYVKNDKPIASFTAIITGNLKVTVDASASYDTETPSDKLEVRWDFENDGVFDTSWSTEKVATHTYPQAGEYTIKMEVKDEAGQISSTTRTVNFQSVKEVSGEVASTTWYGTIYITGDTWVPKGEKLVISAGTQILFIYNDEDNNGVGDYDLKIDGTLEVNGTEDAPVLFTAYSTGDKSPKSWTNVLLTSNSSNNKINWAIFEFGDIGLEIMSDASVSNSTFRNNRIGVFVHDTNKAVNFNTITVKDNLEEGIYFDSVSPSINGCIVTKNGSHGVYISDSSPDIEKCTISYNGKTGLYYEGNSKGNVKYSVIKYNDSEGIRVFPSKNGSCGAPNIEYNNIYSNGVKRSLVIDEVNLSVSTDAKFYGTATSDKWSTPNGETILLVEFSYSEHDSSYYNNVIGYLKKEGGITIFTAQDDKSKAWKDISSYGTTQIYAVIQDYSTSSYYGSMTIYRAAYIKTGASKQITTMCSSGTVTARRNYLGVFPDILPAITYSSAQNLDIQGFVGEAFDSNWDTKQYVGGIQISQDTVWNSDKIVTGDITISSGATLTIGNGVKILFVPVDQDFDGTGDYSIVSTGGSLEINGLPNAKVVLKSYKNQYPEKGAYKGIFLTNASSSVTNVEIYDANTAFNLVAGAHSIESVVIENPYDYGIHLASGSTLDLTKSTIKNSKGYGIYVSSSTILIDQLEINASKKEGILFKGTTGTIDDNVISNCTIVQNQGAGVKLTSSSKVTIQYCNIKYNLYGIEASGDSTVTAIYNNIQYNKGEGVYVHYNGSHSPSNCKFNYNNIFGNSTEKLTVVSEVNDEATTDASFYGTKTSEGVSTPDDEIIEFFSASYVEKDSSYYDNINGYILNKEDKNTIVFFNSNSSLKWYYIKDKEITQLMCKITDYSTSSYYGSVKIHKIVYHTNSSTLDPVELTAIVPSTTNKVDAQNNYWGVFPLDTNTKRIVQGEPLTVDYQGYKMNPIDGTGPQL